MQEHTPWHDDLSSEDPILQQLPLMWKLGSSGWLGFLLSVWFGIAPNTHAAPNKSSPPQRQPEAKKKQRESATTAHNETPKCKTQLRAVQTKTRQTGNDSTLMVSALSPPRAFQVQWPFNAQQTSPQQVKGREILTLSFHLSHTSNTPKAFLVYRNLSSKLFNKEHKIQIKRLIRAPLQDKGLFRWSLQKLPFGPGDLIEYFIEVEDSNSYSCVQRQRTARRYLKFFSPIEQHCKIMKQEKKLLHDMVDFLADLLEAHTAQAAPKAHLLYLQKVHKKSAQLQHKLRQLYRSTRRDRMARKYSLAALKILMRHILQRHQKRQALLRHRTHEPAPTLCLLSRFQKALRRQIRQEIVAQERDIHAVRKFLQQQESDLLDALKSQLSQAHHRVRRLAVRYRQFHQANAKRALASSLQHLDRLLRQIKQHIK